MTINIISAMVAITRTIPTRIPIAIPVIIPAPRPLKETKA